jgi:hypothetical protein
MCSIALLRHPPAAHSEQAILRDFKDAAQIENPGRRDRVSALFVFLYLLKSKIKSFSQLALAHSQFQPLHADRYVNLVINGLIADAHS